MLICLQPAFNNEKHSYGGPIFGYLQVHIDFNIQSLGDP